MILSRGSNEVVYINAGHLPPVLWNHCEESPAILHGRGGPPLGIVTERKFAVERILLKPCDCILLSTDGLIESKNAQGERFGWERLVDTLKAGKSDIESVKSRIERSIDDFVRECPQADDTTLVLVGVEEG
jgi:sigma-B regulation protein RsbU (phosphoserine phosphatase)